MLDMLCNLVNSCTNNGKLVHRPSRQVGGELGFAFGLPEIKLGQIDVRDFERVDEVTQHSACKLVRDVCLTARAPSGGPDIQLDGPAIELLASTAAAREFWYLHPHKSGLDHRQRDRCMLNVVCATTSGVCVMFGHGHTGATEFLCVTAHMTLDGTQIPRPQNKHTKGGSAVQGRDGVRSSLRRLELDHASTQLCLICDWSTAPHATRLRKNSHGVL